MLFTFMATEVFATISSKLYFNVEVLEHLDVLPAIAGGEADPDTCAAPGWCPWEVSLNPILPCPEPLDNGRRTFLKGILPQPGMGQLPRKTIQDPTTIY